MISSTTAIISIISAAVIFYIRSCMIKAEKQKAATTRATAYLTFWKMWAIENNFYPLLHIGEQWNEETASLLKSGCSGKDLVALENTKRTELENKVKEEIKNGVSKEQLEDMKQKINRVPAKLRENLYEQSKLMKQNIVDGKTFLSDEESSIVGYRFSSNSIDLKMDMIYLIDTTCLILESYFENEESFKINEYEDLVIDLVWKVVLIGKNIDNLLQEASQTSNASIKELTLKNLFL